MLEMLQYEFMRNALLAAVLVSVACGIVGTFVVTKRIVFISGGITHAAFGGIGLGYLLEVNPVITAIPFSVLAAVGIGLLNEKIEISEDSAIGILWSVGMALGVLFIGLAPGYAPDLFSYLFGSILTVPVWDLWLMLLLDIVIIFVAWFFFKELQAISFDEEYAEIAGVPTRLVYLTLLAVVALSVIVLIRVVGIILVIALLTIPTVIVKRFSCSLRRIMLWSTVLAAVLTVFGLWLSFRLDVASGSTIVLVLAAAFFVSLIFKRKLVAEAG
ncbi:hypothetical protein AMJ57_05115 [Parcubacteria bacterium SG8_24]|nr:MAG: hypothetical protein AMJ57_05115 [Parcubacteria bacterium SG8_24]